MQSEAGTGGRGGRSLSWVVAAGIVSAAVLVRSAVDLVNALLISAMSALGLAMLVKRWGAASGADRAVIGAACALGLAFCVRVLGMPSIPVESVRELESLGRLVPDPGRTLVIARQGGAGVRSRSRGVGGIRGGVHAPAAAPRPSAVSGKAERRRHPSFLRGPAA